MLLAAVLYASWSVWTARAALRDARHATTDLRAALTAGDSAAARSALGRLQDDASTARARTAGWGALEALPAIGDDLSAVRALAVSLDDIAARGLPGLIDSAGVVDGSAVTPRHGRVDTAALVRLQTPMHDAATEVAAAVSRLQPVDSDGLLDALRGPFIEARDDLIRADQALSAGDRAVGVLPSILGADGPRTWLLVFQNNAEVRGTGGLPGAVTVVRTDHGRISQVRHAVGNQLGHSERAILPLTKFEKHYYGPQVGQYFLDANLSPDFPRAAELMRAWWQAGGGGPVDGIIALDPVTLSYLLEATGPIPVEGGQLTADNAIDLLLHQVYLRYPDPADQDAFLADVASRVFDAIATGRGDAGELVSALARGAEEHRVFVHSFDPAEQSRIAGSAVSGELWSGLDGPRVDIALNDATAAKMQYFLRYDVAVTGNCAHGTQTYDVTMTARSATPPHVKRLPDYVTGGNNSGTPVGSQLVLVDVFGPAGGTLGRFSQDGQPLDLFSARAHDRPVVQLPLELRPGQATLVRWSMTAAPGESGATTVTVTPGVEPGSRSSDLSDAC